MIPKTNTYTFAFDETVIPTNTFKIVYEKDRVNGTVDGIEALKQAIYLIFNTERYQHPIYSWRYGIELHSLIGTDPLYAIPEIKRRVSEALLQDDRILSVDNFEFTSTKKIVRAKCVVTTIYGGIDMNLGVNIGGYSTGGMSSYEVYNGSYNIIPSASVQTLNTKNKILLKNMTVEGIPIEYSENDGGGITITIG